MKWTSLSFVPILALLFQGCSPSQPDGAELAAQHCGSCHQVPSTETLPKETWPYLLDLMGLYFGYDDGALLASTPDAELRARMFDLGRYPDSPTLSREDWQSIRDYYEQSAGQPPVDVPPAGEPLAFFDTQEIFVDHPAPVISLVHISDEPGFDLGDAWQRALHRVDSQGQVTGRQPLPGVPEIQPHQVQQVSPGFLWQRLGARDLVTGAAMPCSKLRAVRLRRAAALQEEDQDRDGRQAGPFHAPF